VSGMAELSWCQSLPLIPAVLRETHAGRIWAWRLPIVIILAAASWSPLQGVSETVLLLASSAALMLCESLTSHAIDWGALTVVVHFLHQAAVALWIGAILGLWYGARRIRLGEAWVGITAPWVSRMAEWTVVALLLSGLYTAYYALMGDPTMLVYAAYGRVLLIKLSAAALVLLIGAYNRFVLIPQVDRPEALISLVGNVAIESVLLIGVIGIAAVLANTPPTHH
jgi:putative copper export protein